MKDRRTDPRRAILVDVSIRTEDNFFTGESRDISTGGLFVTVDASTQLDGVALDVGAPITVCLRILGVLYSIPCEVVWQVLEDDGRISGAGLTFLETSAELRHTIKRFMDHRPPMELDVRTATSLPPRREPPSLPPER